MRHRSGAMPIASASLLVLAACAGGDDLFSPTSAAGANAASLSVAGSTVPALAMGASQDTIALGDTASVGVYGSKAGAGAMYYYALDTAVVSVNHTSGALKGSKLGATRVVGVMQGAGYTTVAVNVVVSNVGSARKAIGSTGTIAQTPTPSGTTTSGTTTGGTGGTTTPVTPPVTTPVTTPVVTATAGAAAIAQLPRVVVDTRVVPTTGKTITVNAGGSFQAALNAAKGGDVIVLQAGATFVGNFMLPYRGDQGWVTIRTSTPDGVLPMPGSRVHPTDAPLMPKILANTAAPAIQTVAGTSGWRLVGLEISAASNVTQSYGLVGFGDGSTAQKTLAQVPSRLILDRSYVHGTSSLELRRCVGMNSAMSAVIDSHLGECHEHGSDSQAIWGWSGPGPFKIENNYLEAGHEVVGFGGPTSQIQGLIPSDIEIRHNYITRPMSWKGNWNAKNLFELKGGQRVLFEGNVLENNWVAAQNGFAIVLQTLSDDNLGHAWVNISDVTIRNNIIRNTAGGINLAARIAYAPNPVMPSNPTARITIYNNTIDLAQNASLGSNGIGFQLLGDLRDISISHNTMNALSSVVLMDVNGTGYMQRLDLMNNVFGKTNYPIIGNSAGQGTSALVKFAPTSRVLANVFAGTNASGYPAGNFYTGGLSVAGLASTDGAPLGANLAAINAATLNATK